MKKTVYPKEAFIASLFLEDEKSLIPFTIKNIHTKMEEFRKDIIHVVRYCDEEDIALSETGILIPLKLTGLVKIQKTKKLNVSDQSVQKIEEFSSALKLHKLYNMIVAPTKYSFQNEHLLTAVLPVLKSTPNRDISLIFSQKDEVLSKNIDIIGIYKIKEPVSFEFSLEALTLENSNFTADKSHKN